MSGSSNPRRSLSKPSLHRAVRAFATATTGAALLLLGGCSSPTESVPCETRWSEVQWTALGLDGFTVTGVAETPWGLFAATDTQGVYRLDATTGDWEGRGLDGVTITTLALAGPPDRVLAGAAAEWEGWSPPDTVIFATQDGGGSWNPSDSGFPLRESGPDAVRELAVDAPDPSRVFAGGAAGVLRSADAGVTWERVSTVRAIGIGLAPGGVVLVGYSLDIGAARLIRSADNGTSWERIELPYGSIASPGAFAVDPETPSRIWMATGALVRRSEDAGVTWTDAEDAVALSNGPIIGLAAWPDAVVAILRRNTPDLQDIQLFFSCDAGDSWDEAAAPSEIQGAERMTVAEDGAILVGTTGAGVWRVEAVGR